MIYSKLQRKNANWQIFPNLKEIAYYSFFTQSVHLSSIEAADIENLREVLLKKQGMTSEKFKLWKDTVAVLNHEYSHWIDNISTIWGLNLLIDVFKAFELKTSDLRGEDRSEEYYIIKDLRDYVKRLSCTKYYTTVNNNVENKYPWIAKYSIGRFFKKDGRLSNYPIFFTRFYANPDNYLICRVPFSLTSIVESIAIANEIYAVGLGLNLLPDVDKQIEAQMLEAELRKMVYDPNLCAYNVAAHHVANCCQIFDIYIAYIICAILGRFVLNFPSNLFSKIIINNDLINCITNGVDNEIWMQAYKVAFDNKDRGVLFFLLGSIFLYDYKNNFEYTVSNIVDRVDDLINMLGLNLNILKEEYTKEFYSLIEKLDNFRNPMANYIAQKAKLIFNIFDMWNSYPYNFFKVIPIPAILGDDSLLFFYGKENMSFNIYEYVFQAMDLEQYLLEFEEACVI